MTDRSPDYITFLPAVYQSQGGKRDAAFLHAYLAIFQDLLDRTAPVAARTGRAPPSVHRRGLADVIDILPDLFYPRLSFLFPDADHFMPMLQPSSVEMTARDQRFDRLNDYFGISAPDAEAGNWQSQVSTEVGIWLDNLLTWQATWIGLDCDKKWSLDKKRLTLATILPCFRQRGTAAGLQQLLSIAFDADIVVTDRVAATPMEIGHTTRLEHTLAAGDPVVGGVRPFSFEVTLTVPTYATDTPEIQAMVEAIKALVDREKPALTNYRLAVETSVTRLGIDSTIGIAFLVPLSRPNELWI